MIHTFAEWLFNCRMDFRWDKFTVTQHLKEMGVMSD